MNVGLNGKVIVITGAASGIGRAVAIEAAASGAAGLFLTDREDVRHDGLDGPDVNSLTANLADTSTPDRIVEAALKAFGRIDGLVNAAGVTDRAGFHDATPDHWDMIFAVNAKAPFFLMKAAIAGMTHGSIVNILSVNAHCGTPELAVYSASKGALSTLTKNAAHTLMGKGIRVNGINLGWTLTEGEHRMQADQLGMGDNWADRVAADLPFGRLLSPDEAARLAIYLLSDASAPLSGVDIDLDQRVRGAMW